MVWTISRRYVRFSLLSDTIDGCIVSSVLQQSDSALDARAFVQLELEQQEREEKRLTFSRFSSCARRLAIDHHRIIEKEIEIGMGDESRAQP